MPTDCPTPRRKRPGPRYIKNIRLMTDEWEVIQELLKREHLTEFGDLTRRALASLAKKHGLEWPE